MQNLTKESNVTYLKEEYRDEVFLSQGKPLTKVILLKSFAFTMVVIISLVNLFSSLDGSYMLIGISMVYFLFVLGMKAILQNQRPVKNITIEKSPNKHKSSRSNEYEKLAKEYSKKYRKYKNDLNKYI